MAPAVPEAALPGLDSKVDQYLGSLLKAATKSPEWEAKAADAEHGDRRDPLRGRVVQPDAPDAGQGAQRGSLSQGSKVGKTLFDLRRTVEDLDPSQAAGAKKFLGMIPFGDRITDYFRKYQSAQSHLNGILHSLQSGQDELQKDNVALNLEKKALWESMGRLNQYVYVAERLDARLAAQVATLDTTDPEKAKALREDVLFYVRQKHQDLLTQLAVSIQNYLAIDIIIKNNIELIKGVDRATDHGVRPAHGRHRRPGPQQPTARPRPDHRAQHDDLRPHRAHVRAAQDQLGPHPGAVGRLDDQHRVAPEGLRQHLRDDGHHRPVQGAGPGQHGRDDRRPRERGDEVLQLPRAGRRPGRATCRRRGRALDLGSGGGL